MFWKIILVIIAIISLVVMKTFFDMLRSYLGIIHMYGLGATDFMYRFQKNKIIIKDNSTGKSIYHEIDKVLKLKSVREGFEESYKFLFKGGGMMIISQSKKYKYLELEELNTVKSKFKGGCLYRFPNQNYKLDFTKFYHHIFNNDSFKSEKHVLNNKIGTVKKQVKIEDISDSKNSLLIKDDSVHHGEHILNGKIEGEIRKVYWIREKRFKDFSEASEFMNSEAKRGSFYCTVDNLTDTDEFYTVSIYFIPGEASVTYELLYDLSIENLITYGIDSNNLNDVRLASSMKKLFTKAIISSIAASEVAIRIDDNELLKLINNFISTQIVSIRMVKSFDSLKYSFNIGGSNGAKEGTEGALRIINNNIDFIDLNLDELYQLAYKRAYLDEFNGVITYFKPKEEWTNNKKEDK